MGNVKQAGNIVERLITAFTKMRGGMDAGVLSGALRSAGSYTGEIGAGAGNQISEIIAKLIGANSKGIQALATNPFRNLKNLKQPNSKMPNPRAVGSSLVNTGIATAPVALGASMFGKSSEAYDAGFFAECRRRGIDPRSVKRAQAATNAVPQPAAGGYTGYITPQVQLPAGAPPKPRLNFATQQPNFTGGSLAPLLAGGALSSVPLMSAMSNPDKPTATPYVDVNGQPMNEYDYMLGRDEANNELLGNFSTNYYPSIIRPWRLGNITGNAYRYTRDSLGKVFGASPAWMQRQQANDLTDIRADLQPQREEANNRAAINSAARQTEAESQLKKLEEARKLKGLGQSVDAAAKGLASTNTPAVTANGTYPNQFAGQNNGFQPSTTDIDRSLQRYKNLMQPQPVGTVQATPTGSLTPRPVTP